MIHLTVVVLHIRITDGASLNSLFARPDERGPGKVYIPLWFYRLCFDTASSPYIGWPSKAQRQLKFSLGRSLKIIDKAMLRCYLFNLVLFITD
jgi:hypothetical protein